MSERKPPSGESLYRGPSKAPRDKRERERDRASQPRPSQAHAEPPPREPSEHREPRAPLRERLAEAAPVALSEQRLYGFNACMAVFGKRPEALRKVWLLQARIPKLKPVIEYCVKHRIGYTVVEATDLEKLSGSAHHEGVVFSVLPVAELSLAAWLRTLARGPQLAIWLDGVGNPHNLGAILRSAAHFGAAGVLLPQGAQALSGAAARVAEGGAEAVPLVRLGRSDEAIAQLQAAGFQLAATVVRGGQALYAATLPDRFVLVMGAEQMGVAPELAQALSLRLIVPGSGKVESLNVSVATAVFLGEWWRQHATSVG